MTDNPNQHTDKETDKTALTEQKKVSFQPFLQITRTRTTCIGHKRAYAITHETGFYTADFLSSELPNGSEHSPKPALSDENATLPQNETAGKADLSGQKDPHSEIGLDCSGQGECQPGIVPSDSDEMQQFLIKRRKDVNKQIKQKKRKRPL